MSFSSLKKCANRVKPFGLVTASAFFAGLLAAMFLLYPMHVQGMLKAEYGVNSVEELNGILSPQMSVGLAFSLQENVLLASNGVLVAALALAGAGKLRGSGASRKLVIAIIVIAVCAGCLGGDRVSLASAESATIIIDPATAFVNPYSAIIYQSGTISYAVNGTTGQKIISGADSNTIQSVLDTTRGLSFIKKGTYSISATIIYEYDNQTIIGESPYNTIFKAVNSLNVDVISINGKKNTWLESIQIDGNYQQQTSGRGVFAPTGSKIHIRNCVIVNCKTYGIHFLDASDDNVVEWTTIKDAQYVGIQISNSSNNRIAYNEIIGSYYDGISVYYYSCHNQIVGNRVINNSRFGIIVGMYSSYNLVSNNYVDGNGDNPHGTAVYGLGIYVVSACKGVTVTGNVAYNNRGMGIGVESEYGVAVSGNVVANNDLVGIILDTDTGDNNVMGNIVKNNGLIGNASYDDGILLIDSVRNIISNNNVFDDQTPKTQSYGLNEMGTSDYNIISSSIFKGSVGGIHKVGENTQVNLCYNNTEWIQAHDKTIYVPTNAGWGISNLETGGVGQFPACLAVFTGVTANSRGLALADAFGLNSGSINKFYVDWTKRIELSFTISRINSDSEVVGRVQLKESGVEGMLIQRGLGIEINNYDLVGEAYGLVRGTVNLGTLQDDRIAHIKIVLTEGTVEFWVNSVLKGTLTGTAVPSVEGASWSYIISSIINGATGGINAYMYIGDIQIVLGL